MIETRVYLAGPMTNVPLLNFPAFINAARALRAEGYSVFNPAEKDIENGITPDNQPSHTLSWFMAIDLPEVCRADILMMLDDWQASGGATIETIVAVALKKPILDYKTRLPISKTQVVMAFLRRHFAWEI